MIVPFVDHLNILISIFDCLGWPFHVFPAKAKLNVTAPLLVESSGVESKYTPSPPSAFSWGHIREGQVS